MPSSTSGAILFGVFTRPFCAAPALANVGAGKHDFTLSALLAGPGTAKLAPKPGGAGAHRRKKAGGVLKRHRLEDGIPKEEEEKPRN
jgi:hypothetical protein